MSGGKLGGRSLIPINPAFGIILAAETVSAIGSQISIVALPLTAVLVLHATPWQIGVLTFALTIPNLLFSLIGGALADRVPRRDVLLSTNFFSASVIAIVPISYFLGFLTLGLLCSVGFVASAIGSLRGSLLLTLIPDVVEKDTLSKANGQLSSFILGASIFGPSVAGGLISLFSAPGAVAVDALSFFFAAVMIIWLPKARAVQANLKKFRLKDITGGFSFLFNSPEIKSVIFVGCGVNFLGSAAIALTPLFIVQRLGVSPSLYGLALGFGGFGGLLGALASSRLSKKYTLHQILFLVMIVLTADNVGLSLLNGAHIYAASGFALLLFIEIFASAVLGVALNTSLQLRAPDGTMGLIFGALSTMLGIARPVGALSGGLVAELIGVRGGIGAIALGCFLITVFLFIFDLRRAGWLRPIRS